jgi:GGDEF domain-containing protein
VSVSIGALLIGRFNLELSTEQWLERSDRALYVAKERGRNRVELDTSES